MKSKLILLLVLLVVVSCSQNSTETVKTDSTETMKTGYDDYVPRLDAFEYSQKCPHMCWLGINPGVTTAEEARRLLGSSSQIDQASYVEKEEGFSVDWEEPGLDPMIVYITMEKGVVEEISIPLHGRYTMQDMIDLLGELDEINFYQVRGPDGEFFSYQVYYTSIKAFIVVNVAGDNAPDPKNFVAIFSLNYDPEGRYVSWMYKDYKKYRQPWLGFGHLEEYLKNRPFPLE